MLTFLVVELQNQSTFNVDPIYKYLESLIHRNKRGLAKLTDQSEVQKWIESSAEQIKTNLEKSFKA